MRTNLSIRSVRSFLALAGASLLLAHSYVHGHELAGMAGVPGGLVVHLGVDGAFGVGGGPNDRYVVHGLDVSPETVAAVRARIHARGGYGPVSAATFDGKRLPYANGLVNLIVADDLGDVRVSEVLRVLCPRGVLLTKRSQPDTGGLVPLTPIPTGLEGWHVYRKPPDSKLDEWTHYLYGPDNNAVCQDEVVGIPRSIQWVAAPRWGRSHEELASMSATVTANGRIYYIVDDAPLASIRFAGQWKLVARDAFNGVQLWERPIARWNDHLRHFRSGPVHLPRRLTVSGDTVFATDGFGGPVLAIAGATGATIREFAGTESTEEILVTADALYLAVGTSEVNRRGGGLHLRGEPEPTPFRRIMVFSRASGSLLWQRDCSATQVLPLSMAVKNDHLYYQSTAGIVCLNAHSGSELWTAARATPARRMAFSAPTLVATDGVVLCADREPGKAEQDGPAAGAIEWGVHGWNEKGFARKGKSVLRAYAAADGRELWSVPCKEGYNSPVDVFVIKGTVWVGPDYRGFDLGTGESAGKIDTKAPRVGMAHHRCYRNKASEQFIFTGKSGIEVLSLAEKRWLSNNSWVRGTCQYGIMPANGLLYAPPDACACFLTVKAPGFVAVAPQVRATSGMVFPERPVLERGVAFGKALKGVSTSQEWPMYRHNPQRTGATPATLPEFPTPRWSVAVGGRLTQPAVVGDTVVVASIDTHTVHALSVADGREIWRHTAGGRVDSTPTIHAGAVLFGAADGWVTCLDLRDGAPVWRFRAAPEERLVNAYGQLESTWPVHGAVLVQNDAVYAMAGRSSYLDGGLVLYRLNPQTGEQLSRTVLYHIDPETGKQLVPEARFNMEGTTSDILSGDGTNVFLKYFTFDREGQRIESTSDRLFAIAGLLGEEWFVRSYWIIGREIGAGWGGWANAANRYPSGRILSFNGDLICGYSRRKVSGGPVGHRADAYHLFAVPPGSETPQTDRKGRKRFVKSAPTWVDTKSLTVRSMVLGANLLAVAGPVDLGVRQEAELAYANEPEARAAFEGKKGIFLRMCRAKDGRRLSECPLPAKPVFDGLSAANGRLFLSLQSGSLMCFGPGSGELLPDSASASVGAPQPAPPSKSKQASAKPSGPPPKLTGKDRRADFAHVEAEAILEKGAGYRLASGKGKTGLAVKALPKPLKARVVLKGTVKPAARFGRPALHENAYIAFGDGTGDTALVKCGLKFIAGTAVIIEGPAKGGAAVSERLSVDTTKPVPVEVAVDLQAQSVSMRIGKKTFKTQLQRKLAAVTHVGYCATNAVSDFSVLEVTGE
ncbi:MAG: PQQ-binding-like beta-propeller repeat protein [Lentisphaerae bacterium]|nr:PQQ-binding-like beta-propeller repeat protein [Lentisphaerota bacterium]